MTGSMLAASASETSGQLFLFQGPMFALGVAVSYLPAASISRQYLTHNQGVANGIGVSGGAVGRGRIP